MTFTQRVTVRFARARLHNRTQSTLSRTDTIENRRVLHMLWSFKQNDHQSDSFDRDENQRLTPHDVANTETFETDAGRFDVES
jgi:hypothetical protein